MSTTTTTVSLTALTSLLNDPAVLRVWAEEYDHIAPFTAAELEDFLTGKTGEPVHDYGMGLGRSYQVIQVLSAVGADLVDKNIAPPKVHDTYKALWQIDVEGKCPYCRGKTRGKLMFQLSPTCLKPRCQLAAMRED